MIYVCFLYYAAIAQVWINIHRQNVFYTVILWYSYRKRTKKPWRKRQSGSWRFSFHKYFTTFFYLFLFFNHFTLFYFCEVHLLKVGRVFASSTRYAVLNALITTCHGNLQIDITRNGEGQSGQESEEKAGRKWLANGWRWWACGRRWSSAPASDRQSSLDQTDWENQGNQLHKSKI